jgi:hypothetical protein
MYTYTTNKSREEPLAPSFAEMLAGGLLLGTHPEARRAYASGDA